MRLSRRILRHRYLVTLDNGEAFSGVLLARSGEHYELGKVKQLSPEGEFIPVDGTLLLERSRVLYAQKEL